MKKSLDVLVVAAIITLVMGLTPPSAATFSEEGTCILKAYPNDVYLEVYDWDNDGNRLGILWQGRLNAGKSITINAPHGVLSWDYNAQPDVDQPLDSAQKRMCNSNETFNVP